MSRARAEQREEPEPAILAHLDERLRDWRRRRIHGRIEIHVQDGSAEIIEFCEKVKIRSDPRLRPAS